MCPCWDTHGCSVDMAGNTWWPDRGWLCFGYAEVGYALCKNVLPFTFQFSRLRCERMETSASVTFSVLLITCYSSSRCNSSPFLPAPSSDLLKPCSCPVFCWPAISSLSPCLTFVFAGVLALYCWLHFHFLKESVAQITTCPLTFNRAAIFLTSLLPCCCRSSVRRCSTSIRC